MMEQPRSLYYRFVEISAALLLLSYPTLMLVVKGGMNGVFLAMLLLALLVGVIRPASMNAVTWRREWTIYSSAMVALSIAICISQIAHQKYSGHPYDAASRFWLAIPVFMLLRRLRQNVFVVLQYAFPMAAIVGYLLAKDYDLDGRLRMFALNAIPYGNFEIALGMLSLLSIDWLGRDKRLVRILKLCGFTAGLAASLASGSRGGWMAIPVFLVIYIYFKTGRVSARMLLYSLIAGVLVFTLLYSFHDRFSQRVNVFKTEVTMFNQEFSSLTNRWRLYKAAVEIFLHQPITGVGPEGFALQMQPMMEAGKLTYLDAVYGRGEVHNDILSKAAGMGIFGLIAILAIYVVPFRMFWKATRSALPHVKRAGFLGVTFVSGFFVFGLTVEILNLTMATAFYSFTVAVLLAVCYNVHNDEPSTSLNLKANKIDV